MRSDIVERIVKWNSKRNLLTQGIDTHRGVGFIQEELYEILGFADPKTSAKEHINHIKNIDGIVVSEGDILDGYTDVIVFAVGEMAKTLKSMYPKLSDTDISDKITEICHCVMDANDNKGSVCDAEGKIQKDDDFEAPMLDLF